MKKIIKVILITVFLITGIAKQIFAEGDYNTKISSDAVAIMTEDTYYSENSTEFTVSIEENEVHLTRQIRLSNNSNNTIEWEKNNIVLVPSENKTVNDIVTMLNNINNRWNDHEYHEDADPTLSVKLYSTIYYSTKTENNRPKILLTKVSGGATIFDSNVYLSSQTVGAGCVSGYGGGQSTNYYPTTLSWSYNSPSSWDYVYNFNPIVGAWYKVTIQRETGGNPWTFQIDNYYE